MKIERISNLKTELEMALIKINVWSEEGHKDLPQKQVIELLNNIEGCLAKDEYQFYNTKEA